MTTRRLYPDEYRQSRRNRATIVNAEAGLVDYGDRKKVAIVGFSDSRLVAPWHDDDTVIWGLNDGWHQHLVDREFRADAWFELHELHAQSAYDLEAMRRCPVPLYTVDDYSRRFPNAVAFPLDRVVDDLSAASYFACTFAYQVALAIWYGFEEIGLYGVDLAYGTARERTVEKATVEYWLGIATGRGISLTLSETLLKHPHRYGFDYDAEVEWVNETLENLKKLLGAEALLEILQADPKDETDAVVRAGLIRLKDAARGYTDAVSFAEARPNP